MYFTESLKSVNYLLQTIAYREFQETKSLREHSNPLSVTKTDKPSEKISKYK